MNESLLKWELKRERFHIEENFPPPEKRSERPIREILNRILEKDNAASVVLPEALVQRWPIIVGQQLEKHVRPSHVREDILYLHADHPLWLSELKRLSKANLLKKIRSIPGILEIKDIRFQLSPDIRAGQK